MIMANARKLSAKDVARFKAIAAAKKARAQAPANDNQGKNPKCAYVNTTMTPGMLKACIETAGYPA